MHIIVDKIYLQAYLVLILKGKITKDIFTSKNEEICKIYTENNKINIKKILLFIFPALIKKIYLVSKLIYLNIKLLHWNYYIYKKFNKRKVKLR